MFLSAAQDASVSTQYTCTGASVCLTVTAEVNNTVDDRRASCHKHPAAAETKPT